MAYTPPKRIVSNMTITQIEKVFARSAQEIVQLKNAPPVLSVLLPMYRAENIGWVAFESLIRQAGVMFDWELLVIEENFNTPMGRGAVLKYAPQLQDAGCCRIVYISLDAWIPLASKWYYLMQSSDLNSKVIALHSADCYSPPERLAKQYRIMKDGEYNWYKLPRSVVYDIETDYHVRFYSPDPDRPDTHSPAITSELFRKIPLAPIRMGVDGWIYNVLSSEEKIVSYFDDSDMWKNTVNVNGLNLISYNRATIMQRLKPPFFTCCSDMSNHLPEEVVFRLKDCYSLAKEHREVWEKEREKKAKKKKVTPPPAPPVEPQLSAREKKLLEKKRRRKKLSQNLISIIGTRPQYVKVKPIYDYCLQNNIRHKIIDTNQHYSNNMSKAIIKSLGLSDITKLNAGNTNELTFMSRCISSLYSALSNKTGSKVLVYGDTNTTFCAALVCYKLGIKLGHVEAGARCFNNKVPEEINRIFADSVSDVGFCFAQKDMTHINHGVLSGDLEYELLNSMSFPAQCNDGPIILTVHRKSNLTKERIDKILAFCGTTGHTVVWPIHHSVSNSSFFKEVSIPKNVTIIEPLNYSKMTKILNECKFIISDSGGLLKTAPFFGKRILILRDEVGRTEVIDKGYGKFATFLPEDIQWALSPADPDRKFFLYDVLPSKCIVETMNG
jgi:UDP-GlcNAc3NAcA epimerase